MKRISTVAHSRRALLSLALIMLGCASSARADWGYDPNSQICVCQDFRTFDVKARVTVNVNMQSFRDLGFPSNFTELNVHNAIRNSVENIRQLSGIDLDLRFGGTVAATRRQPNDREILIVASEVIPVFRNGVAVSFGIGLAVLTVYNQSLIQIARKSLSGTNLGWQMFAAVPNETNFSDVVIHEIIHSLGLGHNDRPMSVMNTGGSKEGHYGPFRDDVEDLQALYGTRKLSVFTRINGNGLGTQWTPARQPITSVVKTVMPVSVALDAGKWLMFYVQPDRRVTKIHGRAETLWDSAASTFANRSLYGVTVHGFDNEYMATWVDFDTLSVRVIRSRDGGVSWSFVNPDYSLVQSLGLGTPAVHKLGADHWILMYPKRGFGATKLADDGKVVMRISTDDGATWGPETEQAPEQKLRAVRGVSIAAHDRTQVRYAFTVSSATLSNRVAVMQIRIGTALTNVSLLGFDVGSPTPAHPDVFITRTKGTEINYLLAYRGPTGSYISRSMPRTTLVSTPEFAINPSTVFSPVDPSLMTERDKSLTYLHNVF